ncbi:imidazole glycerol phosphate synthase subunit HisH [Poseidonibacter lekithochrous]|uniref:imidazole glycerol phosphate synthase subunit HisH n=1 Tax=Poseidonibacter lekithochrous TaxID=1904463 RepID=UPI000A63F8E1|nr:imidazole glycerol phosphate synthase subunit HisH [Poseidonibacter lekithochrous]QKJ22262.1 glutamine amidotransferase WbuY [Poseidonibacter lekithochrous]
MKIVVIDYDIGNVKSIINALENIGITPQLTNERNEILKADAVILPGVGAFKHGMENLKKYELIESLLDFIKLDKPFLGICLGMQMLLEESEEFGITKGLSVIEGKIKKLPVKNLNFEKLPHVSWNEIRNKNNNWKNTILNDIGEYSDMYFVHSFVAMPKNENDILSTTLYSDYEFVSSLKKGNVYGCQFHPEKSGEIGLKILKNFVNICKGKYNG